MGRVLRCVLLRVRARRATVRLNRCKRRRRTVMLAAGVMSSDRLSRPAPPAPPARPPRAAGERQDVARAAGVSAGTVSNVLDHPERVREDKRRRVEAAVRDLGYVRNESARHLRSGSSRTLGLLLLDAWNPFFTDLAHGVEDWTADRSWALLISNSAREPERESLYLDLFAERRVQGVIAVPTGISPTGSSPCARRGSRRWSSTSATPARVDVRVARRRARRRAGRDAPPRARPPRDRVRREPGSR